MKCYMGQFGQPLDADKLQIDKEFNDQAMISHSKFKGRDKNDYYSDEEDEDYSWVYPLENPVFESYSDDPLANFRYGMREPSMLPVKRGWGKYYDRKYYSGDDAKPVQSAALIIEETINPNASDSPSVLIQEQVSAQQGSQDKTGRNIVLGVGAALAALVVLNR